MAERGGVQGNPFSPYQIQVASGTYSMSGQASGGWFGPLAPMPQAVPDAVRGRAFDLVPGYNLNTRPRAYEAINFHTLRALADGYDLLRLVIETRKDQVGRQSWTVKNRDGVKKDYTAQIQAVTKFFRRPDGVTNWKEWVRSLLEDQFVIDAPSIYLQRDMSGRLLAMEQVDGATIKPVIDDLGRTPQPFSQGGAIIYPVAYQQILKGMPLDYSVRDLLYRPRNKRAHKVYGFSPVEQVITTVNIALRRQATTLEYFTDGTVPDSFVGVPENWTPSQVAEFQKYWDLLFTGDTAVRRRAKFVPGGMKITQTREPELKGEIDDWLARVVCYAFSVSPQALQKMMNRATAETAKESAEEEGLTPVLDWIKALVDDVIADEFGLPDLEFGWEQDDAVDEATQATVLTTYTSKAVMTVNQARIKLGMDPDPNPAADKLMVQTATGYELLEANTIEGKQAMQDAFPPPPPAPGQGFRGADQQAGGGQQDEGKAAGGAGPTKTGRPASKKQVQKAAGADDAPEPIDADDQEQAIIDALAPAFGETADDVAEQVRAALKKKDLSAAHEDEIASAIAAIVAGLSFGRLADIGLITAIATQLRSVAIEGAVRGVAEANGGDAPAGPTAMAIDEARAAAGARATEMFGLRWQVGATATQPPTLVLDPGAQQNIVETMRADVAGAVRKAISDGPEAVSEAIKALGSFAEWHAATIAATEAMRIGNRAMLDGYTASHVRLNKRWNITSEACDLCRSNSAEGAVGLAHVFKSGDRAPPGHPRCRCVLSCEEIPMSKSLVLRKGFDPAEPRDAEGRFTSGEADEGEELTDAEKKEYSRVDGALDSGHDDILAVHEEIAKHMAALKDLHKKLGKHVDRAQDNLDRLNELEEKSTGTGFGDSDIIEAGREGHSTLGDALDEFKTRDTAMKAARKTFDKVAAAEPV